MKTNNAVLSALASVSLVVLVAGCATETEAPVEERTGDVSSAVVKTRPIVDRASCNDFCFDRFEACSNACPSGLGVSKCISRCCDSLTICTSDCDVMY